MADGDTRDLQEAAKRVQQLSDDYWRVLDPSCKAMEDDAWVGPTGRRFGETVRQERRQLEIQLSAAVDSAKAKVRALPNKP